jgi:GrpB-like predicted nucleotidyltransferase (UPF0157 family)
VEELIVALIEIAPYNPNWPAEFQRVAAPLREAMGDLALRIHHIGSTSVPGLPAKDIIDVQVAVATLDQAEIAARLTSLGYEWREAITGDHVPPEWQGQPEQWSKMFFREPAGSRPTNTHIRVLGHANQRYAVLFRDYLRHDAVSTGAYAQIKFALARLHPDDMDAYYDIKDPACDLIMAAAECWAASTGYEQGGTDA